MSVRKGTTIRQALKKAMKTRDLTPNDCIIYIKGRQIIDWNTDTIELRGLEVTENILNV